MSRLILMLSTVPAVVVALAISLVRVPAADAPGFAGFVDDYFDAHFAWKPSEGTATGLHQYDNQLEDRSAEAIGRRSAALKAFQQRLTQLRAGKLNEDDAIDAEILDGVIRGELLDLDTLRNWKKNPMSYVSTPANSIDGLMKRTFAPPPARLRSIIARLKATPALFAALRANIENPPKEFTDLTIRMADGSIVFFRDTLPLWAKEAAGADAELLKEFDSANAAVRKSLGETADWLKQDLLPRSKGKYALGAEHFTQQLLYEELIDIPLERLRAIAEGTLKRDQEAFLEVGKKVDAKKSALEMMRVLSNDYPAEDDLIPLARRTIEQARQFIVDKKIITIPSEVRPTITETPLYARDGSYASMDTPGPFETKATEAFYYITPPGKDWTPRHKEEHLRLFNRPVMEILNIHEAFPGHYVQFLYAKQYPTKTRKLVWCGSNVEGWAHYCEQMMVEAGYGGGDPKMRLAQLSEALLRDCRFLVSLRMHTQGMTVEEGGKLFESEGFQEATTGYEESRRGAYNPTYLYYTLGKLQIYKLREDYRRLKGPNYSLESFHNEFIKQGGIPIKLIRRIMLPGDKGATL